MPDTLRSIFSKEVEGGLSSDPKRLSSKWFYDERGDDLFVQIMQLPEYYLTKAEEDIFKNQTGRLTQNLTGHFDSFDLIELGAGDGSKTFHLLRELDPNTFTYRPIDISKNAVDKLKGAVSFEFPNVQVDPMQGEYFEVLDSIRSDRPKAILFMGSNIGNLLDERANHFLKGLSAVMNPGDTLLLGVDLKKPRSVVLPAYNDSKGVTAAFNLNVLGRINRELGGTFDLNTFEHSPEYDEDEGIAFSFLRSLKDQDVYVDALKRSFHFSEGEKLFTEISRKYDDASLDAITRDTNLELTARLYDQKRLFCDAIFKRGQRQH